MDDKEAERAAARDEQLALVEKMQLKWLRHMDKLLDAGTITSTDMATLVRFLMANGWTLDPSRIPERLKNKLTSGVSPLDFDTDNELPFRRKA